MSGFTANIINLITDNLRDRYQTGFPIIKELIQNADDAKAQKFIFGHHPGFPEASNPLLRGPALYCYNDGKFKTSDRKAIASFAENTKAGEEGTIGKFGLGMKSVFHLCEAFIYVANDSSEIHVEILNPWNTTNENIHPHWEDMLSEERNKLLVVAKEVAGDDSTWFFLWTPLRRKEHLKTEKGEVTGSIIERFPGDEGFAGKDLSFLGDRSLKNKLAAILPLLPNLSSIQFRPKGVASSGFTLCVEAESRLENSAEPSISTGRVIDVGDAESVTAFHGRKSESIALPMFEQLKRLPTWPKSFCRDERGHLNQENDKSRPEGSVLVCSQTNGSGRLSIQWALFLPLEEESHLFEASIASSSSDYRVFIHGQFFVDAGRKGIYAYNQLQDASREENGDFDEAGVRRRWNLELAQRVVLPQFIPALKEFVRTYDLGDSQITVLTEGIRNAASRHGSGQKFLDIFRKYICAEYSWSRVIAHESVSWEMVDHKDVRRLLPLPPPPKGDLQRPWTVLPLLASMEEGTIFVDLEAPSISTKMDQWSEDELQHVLGGDFSSIFSSSTHMEYLACFLEGAARPYLSTDRLQKVLRELVMQGFRETSIIVLRQNRQKVVNLVQFLLQRYRLPLGTQEATATTAIPDTVFSALWRCDTEVVIIPRYFDASDKPGTAKPERNDVVTWLRSIHNLVVSDGARKVPVVRHLEVARDLLKELDEDDRGFILRNNPDLKILEATDARTLEKVAVSYAILQDAHSRKNLFGFSQGTSDSVRAGLTTLLAPVILEEQVLLVSTEVFRNAFCQGVRLQSSGDGEAILSSLGIGPKILGGPRARQELIKKADNPGADQIARLGLRYLLHGDETHFADGSTPLWVARHDQTAAWQKLWRQVSQIESDKAWNILNRDLVAYLPSACWTLLGIKEIDPADVISELGMMGVARVSDDPFSDSECLEILTYVDDEQVWKGLPFHPLKSGGRCQIDSCAYLDTGKNLPAALDCSIKIVKRIDTLAIEHKQTKWITPLDEASILQIALGHPEPWIFWKLILETLALAPNGLGVEISTKLRETRWLPLRNGSWIKPADVISLPALSQDIQLLASKADYCYGDVADLHGDVLNSSALKHLERTCFATCDEALEALGLLMSEIDGYQVGKISSFDDLCDFLPALENLTILPAWVIVSKAIDALGAEKCLDILLPHIVKPVPYQIIIKVLQQLAKDCSTNNKGAEHAFILYLKEFCTDRNEASSNLKNLMLRSTKGDWKPAENLCTGVSGVDGRYVLDRYFAEILSDVIVDAGQFNAVGSRSIGPASLDYAIEAAPKNLQQYFYSWDGLVRSELIGVLLCLLGPKFRNLAAHFLSGHSYDWVVNEQIGWKSAEIIDENGNSVWISDSVPAIILEELEVGIRTVEEDRVKVKNLLGAEITVQLDTEFTTIIAGAPAWEGKRRVYLPLRKITPTSLSPEALTSLLKETTKYILDKCYYQPRALLDSLWQELEKTDQLQIDVVRGMILEHLPFYLKQLNASHKSEELRDALHKLDQAREQYQESRSSVRCDSVKRSKLERGILEQREHIASILQKDDIAKKAVLEALKQKLKDFQYEKHGIPFELFQNADDAAVELGLFDPDDKEKPQVPISCQKFVVDIEGATLRFMNWGRIINSIGPVTAEGDRKGFRHDLEKMLVLSMSDKPIGEGTTGKFGLGFKSVYLCSDNPCILSGLLRVEIVGGVLPQTWCPPHTTVSRLNHFTENNRHKGTLVELPLNDETCTEDTMKRFQVLAGIQCLFGKAIRRIVIVCRDDEHNHNWQPVEIVADVEVGKCDMPEKDGVVSRFAIVFRLNSGVLFFVLNPEGFTPMTKEVPSIWVTAPTREEESLGFAVSAAFSLDAGRGRLAGHSEENIRLAERIGKELGSVILSLINHIGSVWPSAKEQFHVAEYVSLAGFLASLWRVLSIAACSKDGTGVCSSITLKALSKLSLEPIPNGLPYPFEQLLDAVRIRYELSSPWNQRDVLELLMKYGVSPEECIASEFAVLLRRIDKGRNIQKLDFSMLVQRIENKQCFENIADKLEAITQLTWDKLRDEEKKLALEDMSLLHFSSAAGEWVSSRDLLCAGVGDREEELRVRFAPEKARLANTYGELGKAFFKRCRPRYEAPTELLAEWIRMAGDEESRQAALRYMLNGELGPKVARHIRQNGLSVTWLEQVIERHEYIDSWDDIDKDELLRSLSKKVIFDSPYPEINHPSSTLSATDALNAIYDWWLENKDQQIMQYERKVYPGGSFPLLTHDFLRREPEARKGWLTLFLLGACHTIGRTTPEQHRSFIQLCHAKGWMDKFVTVGEAGLNEWMVVIKNYLQNEIQDPEYFHWFKEFVSIFLFGYWLDDYVDSFQAINKMHKPFSLKQITDQRINLEFQGGGPDAPPIDRALGMGACFVMRELVRKGVISNQRAHKFCYVPRKPVRKFMEHLGCNGLSNGLDHETRSKMVHDFVCEHIGKEKATFGNSFDLPLYIVATNPDLQNALFNKTLVTDVETEEDDEYVQ